MTNQVEWRQAPVSHHLTTGELSSAQPQVAGLELPSAVKAAMSQAHCLILLHSTFHVGSSQRSESAAAGCTGVVAPSTHLLQ